jgi:ribosome biogenesis GTPase A
VKISDRDEEAETEAVYLIDTPGVFIPFVPNAEAMLKLALCGSVKDTIIAPTTLADYLLYHLNKQNNGTDIYGEYCRPTNDVNEFLEGVCLKTGRLGKEGVPDWDAAALWIIQRWRQGNMGTFNLDEVTQDGLEKKMMEEVETSVSQARKQMKDAQRMKARSRKVHSV